MVLGYKLQDCTNNENGEVKGEAVEVVSEVCCPVCLKRLTKIMRMVPL
jgi:hypothetical protein